MVQTLWSFLFYFWVVLEIVISVATRTGKSVGKVSDRGSQLILWIVITSSIAASEFLRHILPPNIPDRGHWLRPASVVLIALGLVFVASRFCPWAEPSARMWRFAIRKKSIERVCTGWSVTLPIWECFTLLSCNRAPLPELAVPGHCAGAHYDGIALSHPCRGSCTQRSIWRGV